MGERVIPALFVHHWLSSGQQEDADQKQQQPHAPVLFFTQPSGFIENKRNSEIVSKEKEQRQKQSKNQEPKRELVKHAEDVGGEQAEYENQTLRAGTASIKQAHPGNENSSPGKGRNGKD